MSVADKPAFAYLRVSTREQDEDNQRLQIQNYAETHGVRVENWGWFIDKISGAKVAPMDRPGFKDMFESIVELRTNDPQDAPANVIVYEISRLGRNFWEMLEVVKALEEIAPIISTSPKESFLQIDDRSMRQLFLTILAWAAEREREYLVQRTNDGLARAKEQNRHSGNIPLGFDQHVCSEMLHKRCELSGQLSLNAMGKQVQSLAVSSNKIRVKSVMALFPELTYHQARSLVINVGKFGEKINNSSNLL